MNKRKQPFSLPRTFQFRMVFFNMLIVMVIASAVSFYNFQSYRQKMTEQAAEASLNRVSAVTERLETAYNEMVNLVVNCAERMSLFFSNSYHNQPIYDNIRSNVAASYVLKDYCAISGYSDYIYKITMYSRDRFVLQAGSSEGYSGDVESIMTAPWFSEYLTQTSSQYSLRLAENPFALGTAKGAKILPLLRPLQYANTNDPRDAWVFLAISQELYQDSLSESGASHIYAVTREGDLVASLDPDQLPVEELIPQLLADSAISGRRKEKLNGRDCMITWEKQMESGLLLFEILPLDEIKTNPNVIGNTILTIFLSCLAIGLLLSLLISRFLAAPINRLNQRLSLIAGGNFDRDDTIETDDEIGAIGRQINMMSERISELLDSRIQSEHEKKDLEIKMLQAQINPHFLYNTLDSIKWIAKVQNNTGIVQVVTALSSLLKNMAKGFNEKVTLKQEFDFLENYVIIEKVRYIELFDVEIQVDNPVLYDAKIIKLTLQPIVENAIFSGIEPSGRFGLIKIRAFENNGILNITVTDNGIGITPENIEKLLSDTARVTKSNMSGIGLPNVDRRLKLVYGESYGITIESEVDSYTKITITLPLEF